MRRFVVLLSVVVLLAGALPVLAQEGDPLAHSVLLPGPVGFALAGLAALLFLLLLVWSARGPH